MGDRRETGRDRHWGGDSGETEIGGGETGGRRVRDRLGGEFHLIIPPPSRSPITSLCVNLTCDAVMTAPRLGGLAGFVSVVCIADAHHCVSTHPCESGLVCMENYLHLGRL